MSTPAAPGLRWHPHGYATLGPELARYRARFDAAIADWARRAGACSLHVPPVIAQETLERCGWIESFPQLALFAAHRAQPDAGSPLEACGCVLNPAACYHVYTCNQGRDCAPLVLATLSAECFRNETSYAPLTRQRSFRMREIVALGGAAQVEATVHALRDALLEWCEWIGLGVRLQAATDPFFLGPRDPRWALQHLAQRKQEIVLEDGLAIGSVNRHGDFFGRAFDISCGDAPVHSACLAFGLERWLHALARHFGEDPARWPLPELSDV